MAVDFRTDSGRLAVYTTAGAFGILVREFNNEYYFKSHNNLILGILIIEDELIYSVNISNVTLNGVIMDPSTIILDLNTLLNSLSNILPIGASTEATQLLVKEKTDNLDVALSTLLKPSDTLNKVSTVDTITNTVTVTGNVIKNVYNKRINLQY